MTVGASVAHTDEHRVSGGVRVTMAQGRATLGHGAGPALDEATDRLYRFIPNARGTVARNLDRMQALLHHLGDPQEAVPVVHIAGTSGKTSTAYFVRGLLHQAGQLTGLGVSPHVESITERVQIAGRPLPADQFVCYVDSFIPMVDRSRLRPTFFEVITAFAFWVFAERRVDYAVVETGIGGLVDATNTVRRPDKLCVVTDIGLDHTDVLGDTVEAIAQHKAGIAQRGNHLLLQAQDPSTMDVVRRHVEGIGATMEVVEPGSVPVSGLPEYQQRNWRMAQATYRHLQVRDGLSQCWAGERGALEMQPPGRMEAYTAGPKVVILDGAHNPHKVAALRRSLAQLGITTAAVLASVLRGPENKIDGTLAELRPLAAHLVVSSITAVAEAGKTSPPAQDLAMRATRLGFASVEASPHVEAAFGSLLARSEPVLVVTGSLYLVGQVRPLVRSAGAVPARSVAAALGVSAIVAGPRVPPG